MMDTERLEAEMDAEEKNNLDFDACEECKTKCEPDLVEGRLLCHDCKEKQEKKDSLPNSGDNRKQGKQRKQRKQLNINIDNIHPAGIATESIVIEPLGAYHYLYRTRNGKIKIVTAKQEEKREGKKLVPGRWYIDVEGRNVYFRDQPLKRIIFPAPSQKKIDAWVIGKYVPPTTQELFKKVERYLRLLFDLESENSFPLVALGVFVSWLAPFLPSVFYQGFDAKPGSGKTSFLEGLMVLCRHGHLTGDVSPAYVGRMIDKYQLSIGIDEVDEAPSLFPLLRKGYRRGTPYTRLNDRTYEEQVFEVYGYKAYTFAGTIDKALKGRTNIDLLRPSDDKRLPVLNTQKEKIGHPLFEDLFFWYMTQAPLLVSYVSDVSVVTPFFAPGNDSEDVDKWREDLYNNILDEMRFTVEEEKAIENLFGRNLELAFTSLHLARLLDIPIIEAIKARYESKQASEEDFSENYYMELLKDLLLRHYETVKSFKPEDVNHASENQYFFLSRGSFSGCWFTPRTRVYEEFRTICRDKGLTPPGSEKFFEYLKVFEWVKDINLKKERCGNSIKESLIFDEKPFRKLHPNQDFNDDTAQEEKIADTSDTKDTPVFSEIKKDYSGKCGYCGKSNAWIRWTDQDGNHVCDKCKAQEDKNEV